MGADGVELDVRRTADDRLVVHHDPTVADGRVIRQTPAADLPDSVPLLGDALDACAGMFVNVEIKNDESEPDFDPTDWVAHRTAVELVRRGADARWLISSFRLDTVNLCHRLLPHVRTASLVMVATEELIGAVAASGHVAIHPSVEGLDRSVVNLAHARGLAVNTWTCNDPDRIRELLSWGVDGICTDVPDVAHDIRAGLASG